MRVRRTLRTTHGTLLWLRSMWRSSRWDMRVPRGTKDVQKMVALDFDGVLSDYSTGFHGARMIGPMLEGAQEALYRLRLAGYTLVVHSTRSPYWICQWLDTQHVSGLFWCVTRRKLPATVFFDDRAMRVRADTPNALKDAVREWQDTRLSALTEQAREAAAWLS